MTYIWLGIGWFLNLKINRCIYKSIDTQIKIHTPRYNKNKTWTMNPPQLPSLSAKQSHSLKRTRRGLFERWPQHSTLHWYFLRGYIRNCCPPLISVGNWYFHNCFYGLRYREIDWQCHLRCWIRILCLSLPSTFRSPPQI